MWKFPFILLHRYPENGEMHADLFVHAFYYVKCITAMIHYKAETTGFAE